jgi:hypothetical protein
VDLEVGGRRLGVTPARPPGDERLIDGLADEIDKYYGTRGRESGRRDARLLWNVSSNLVHGERWFRDLMTTGAVAETQRRQLTELITQRSLDVVCSGLNVLWQRALFLATAPTDTQVHDQLPEAPV